jgi:hypothetical protein
MNPLLYIAAALATLLGVAHSVLGEKYILIRLFRRDDLPKLLGSAQFTMHTLRFAWHLTTIAWIGFAALLAYAARGDITMGGMLRIVGITFVVSGLLPLIFTRGKHWSWVVLFGIGGIALVFT